MAKKSGNNFESITTFLLMGGIFGIVTDMFYGSTGLPGFNTSLESCPRLKKGDIIQIGLESLLLLGALYSGSFRLQAFAAGMLFGGLVPKIQGIEGSRYFLFDFDPSTGSITPVGRLTSTSSGE